MAFDKTHFLAHFADWDTLSLQQKVQTDISPEARAAIEEILALRPEWKSSAEPEAILLSASPAEALHDGKAAVFQAPSVVVKRCWHMLEAGIVKEMLEANGIPAVLADVHLNTFFNIYSVAFGGIRVKVPPGCEQEACQLIASMEAGELALDDEDASEGEAQLLLSKYSIKDAIVRGEKQVACWNPDVAAVLGLIFTPLFPQLLHCWTWRALGCRWQAISALCWLIATLLLLGWLLVWGQVQVFFSFISFPVLLFWYFISGRKQSVLLVRGLQGRYRRRAWSLLLIPLFSIYILGIQSLMLRWMA